MPANDGNTSEVTHEIIIPREHISINALKVVQRLNDFGYSAFLVGGCIRDLLLGLHPKDFDVATDAHPEEVKRIFRNSRIIGRRFKLVHVVFGREIIEVATFRACHSTANSSAHALQDKESGRILKDNVYGTIEDDAARRDFTINALYYGNRNFELVDFSSGIEDLKNRTLRLLGDPEQRYREDPVRILRALRFAAKLDFSIADDTAKPIVSLGSLLESIPSARLFDEVLKIFLNGKGLATLVLLEKYGVFSVLFPETADLMEKKHQAEALLKLALKSTDLRVNKDKPVTPSFLYAAMLWHPMIEKACQFQQKESVPIFPAIQKAAEAVIRFQCRVTAIPRRFSYAVREIWELQPHLEKHHKSKIDRIVSHPRFRAAYDLLVLREASGEDLKGAGQWWTSWQEKNPVPVHEKYGRSNRNVAKKNYNPEKYGKRQGRKQSR